MIRLLVTYKSVSVCYMHLLGSAERSRTFVVCHTLIPKPPNLYRLSVVVIMN